MLSSPKGNQFSTCKEVSAYLMSLLGYPEVKSVTNQYESTGQIYLCANNGADNSMWQVLGSQDQIGSGVDKPNILPVASFNCQKCNLTFCDRTAYEQHHFSCHEMSAKRRRTGKFGEPVVGKDGKFECPICQKTFEEESQYFGHVGSHARYQGLTPEAFFDKATSGRVINGSLAEVSFTPQELTESPGQNNKVSDGEAGFQHHNHSNEHGDNKSTVTELFSTNCSVNFIGPNKAQSRPEEIHPIIDVPSVSRYPSDTGHADLTIPKGASNTSHQSVSNTNGFAGVTFFNGQLGSYHVARPTAFGTANHYQDWTVDHGMAAPKHADNNTVKARDVNLNSSLDTISFPIASANNETSSLNEVNRSSITAKCFSGSFNNNDGASSTSSCSGSTNKISSSVGTVNKTSVVASRCFDPNYGPYGHDHGAVKANHFANKNNTPVYQANMGTEPVYPVATKADCLASRPVQTKDSGKELTSNTKEQMDNVKNRTRKEAGFGNEAYNRGTFTGGVTDRGSAQFNNSFTHVKPNSSSRSSLPQSNTLAADNFIKGSGSDDNCMKGSLANRGNVNFTNGPFVYRPINNNEPNVPMLEVMGKSNNEMQNRYNDCVPGCDPHAASRTSRNVNGLMSTQANFASMSSAVQSVGDVPLTSTTQDQCDLQLGFGAQKQRIFSSHGELRSAATGSPQLGSNARNNSLPTGSPQFGSMDGPKSFPSGTPQFGGGFARPNSVPAAPSQLGSIARPNYLHSAESSQFASMVQPNSITPASSQFGREEPTLVLGYAPQMGSVPPPSVQLGWDSSLPRMVTGGMVTCVCIWCNSQFHHFGPVDGHQAGSFGFICPSCKDRMSGRHNMPNNGSWQP
ncbi:cell wall protein AWA1-like [Panicum miliaceum]|uniref:Cell wall protein AWA1-like n=1 Tax=Panicum miliaceum TaxID=4540 RepID=A0A3L6RIS3_PANMI|nr:cell wall protein AWA1-like [Panicum miliaceum]